MKAHEVLDALALASAFRSAGKGAPHVMLREVSNGTGWRNHRYADALLLSVWPSRGIWMAGVEVKVDRGDWLRELNDPRKSSEHQKHCKYWWLATTKDVVQPEEVPETWGWVEVSGKRKTRVRKKAPQLEPEPLDLPFVAAILRKREETEEARCQWAVSEALEKERATPKDETNVELQGLKQQLELHKQVVATVAEVFGDAHGNVLFQPEHWAQALRLARMFLHRAEFLNEERMKELICIMEKARMMQEQAHTQRTEAYREGRDMVSKMLSAIAPVRQENEDAERP